MLPRNSSQKFSEQYESTDYIYFLSLVQMIIAPLVFSTLVVGIAKLGDLKTVDRVGGKATALVCNGITDVFAHRAVLG